MPAARTEAGTLIWAALNGAHGALTSIELSKLTGVAPRIVNQRLRRWAAADMVTRSDDRPSRFERVDGAPVRAPRVTKTGEALDPEDGRQRLWTVMRIKKTFDVVDLSSCASVSEPSARVYIQHLVAAGYLTKVRHANSHVGTRAVYRLIRSTGPKAPSISKGRGPRPPLALRDPNTGTAIALDRKDAASPASEDGGVG